MRCFLFVFFHVTNFLYSVSSITIFSKTFLNERYQKWFFWFHLKIFSKIFHDHVQHVFILWFFSSSVICIVYSFLIKCTNFCLIIVRRRSFLSKKNFLFKKKIELTVVSKFYWNINERNLHTLFCSYYWFMNADLSIAFVFSVFFYF